MSCYVTFKGYGQTWYSRRGGGGGGLYFSYLARIFATLAGPLILRAKIFHSGFSKPEFFSLLKWSTPWRANTFALCWLGVVLIKLRNKTLIYLVPQNEWSISPHPLKKCYPHPLNVGGTQLRFWYFFKYRSPNFPHWSWGGMRFQPLAKWLENIWQLVTGTAVFFLFSYCVSVYCVFLNVMEN